MAIKKIDDNIIEKTEQIKTKYHKQELLDERRMFVLQIKDFTSRIAEIDELLANFDIK